MSWQLASFAILVVVIVGGFAWYERSRPPAQVVALVAAMAALAIAGRIAFAAFPNVKPTTDIVIFSGFALGAAPGFVVGALAALVSNFWFGQGPWTPWQMVGWGLCGILGAALRLGYRDAGRLALAATCGFAGIAYGALLNFHLMATYGGDLSLERFGVLQARAIPFDAAHVIGNVAFALIAGPAMVRMLIRFRSRFEWRPGGAVAVTALLVALLLVPTPTTARAGVPEAASWLSSMQNRDGGWGASPDRDSGAEMTAWSMLGLAAAGINPLDSVRGGHTPVDFLRANAADLKSPGDLARTILALQAAGVDPRRFASRNLVSELIDKRRKDGSWEGWPGSTAFAVIALRAAGVNGGLPRSLDWLREAQNDDGGWGDVPGSPSTADGTGAVLQALASGSKASQRGLSYLRKSQRSGGGFPLGGSGPTNTQSTAWAVQGILAAGGDPGSFRRGGKSALDYIASRQEANGSYRYSGSSDQTPIWVTGQVMVAAAGVYYPVAAPKRAPKPAPKPAAKPRSNAAATASPSGPTLPSPGAAKSGSAAGGGVAAPGASAGSESSGTALPGARSGASGATGADGGGSEALALPLEATGPEGAVAATPVAEIDESEERSPAGAAFLGLVAGGLLFAGGFGIRRWWMHWRYGL